MNINKTQLKKWIAALDSGEYKQARHKLQDRRKFCCFGVGCITLVPVSKRYYQGDALWGTHADNQPSAPKWLKHINLDFKNKTGMFLTDLNDGGYKFPEIATLLELVYIHKILD